jgi:hypothetical protein
MANLEKWRAHARYCVLMAEKTARPEDKRTWQILADAWLRMLPLVEHAPALEPEEASEELSAPG